MQDWRPVAGWARYEVSNDGRVRSVRKGREPRELRLYRGKDGELTVWLSACGKSRPLSVARLLCEAFHGPAPSPQHRAVVLDGRRTRPTASTVAWLTRAETWRDPRAARASRGRRLSARDARQIRAARPHAHAGDVAAAYRIDGDTVLRIWSGERWRHAGAPTREDLEDARRQLGCALP